MKGKKIAVIALGIFLMKTGPIVAGPFPPTAATGRNPNLAANPSFEETGDTGLARDWNLAGAAEGRPDPAEKRSGNCSQKIRRKTKGIATLSQVIPARPATDYFVHAWVKSDDRVVLRAGRGTMAYTGAGEWQKISGLVRTGTETNLTLQIQLGVRPDAVGTMWVDDVEVKSAARPELGPRPLHGSTALVEQGKPTASIVYPSGAPSYRDLAEKIQQAVAQATGTALPMLTDVEVTEKDAPVLKASCRDRHLILLGRLGINRAMWPAYNRFLDATDGYYPGADGYVVRTAANVLHNGRNHLILGGSTERGAARAVDQFLEHLDRAGSGATAPARTGWLARLFGGKPRGRRPTLTLPWLLDVELGGECLAAFQAHDRLWREDPENRHLPRFECGYGTVLRWYQNAMAYYWSGWPGYWQRAQEHLELVLKDQAYTHQYPLEFLVRVYDMLDDSGKFSAEQMAGVDRLLLRNFWDFGHLDAGWMAVFAPPYDRIHIANRHSIAPWMSDLVLADFIHDSLKVEGDLREVVDFRRLEKDRFLQHVVQTRWGSSEPGVGDGGHDDEVVQSLFRYALDHDRYEFFQSGNAARCASFVAARLNPLSGLGIRPVDGYEHHLVFGILANYFQDGRYKRLLHLKESLHPSGTFMGRYLNGVRRYTPGPELAEAPLDSLAGVLLPPMMPHNVANMQHLNDPRFAFSPLDGAQMLDLAVFRSGFGPDDDYVALSGIRESSLPPNILLGFTSRGVTWFGNTASDKYFEQNALCVQRLDQLAPPGKPFAGVARLDWRADFGDAGGVAATLTPCMGTEWQRAIVWIRPGLYVVRDTVTALEDGRFMFNINWRPQADVEAGDRAWTLTAGPNRLRITPLGALWQTAAVPAVVRPSTWQKEPGVLGQNLSTTLAKDAVVSAVNVLQAARAGDIEFYNATWASAREIVLTAPDGKESPVRVIWGPFKDDRLETDAAAVVLRTDDVQFIRGTSLKIGGRPVIEADRPISLRLGPGKKPAVVDLGVSSPPVTVRLVLARGVEPFARTIQNAKERLDLPTEAGVEGLADLLTRPPQPDTAGTATSPTGSTRIQAQADDRSSDWQVAWRYRGLQRPARITGASTEAGGVVDLGAEYDLAEISNRKNHTSDQRSLLPPEISVAGPDRSSWRKLEAKPEWRPSVYTANYGRGDPLPEGFQVMKLKGVKARFLRGEGVTTALAFHRADVLESREPLQVECVDFENNGKPEILLKSDIWPAYRFIREEDDALAVLTEDGRERFQYDVPTNLQTARVLDWEGTGRKHLLLATVDAMIRVFEPTGRIVKEINLYQLHQEFNREYGRPNERHPAGGYTIPASFGLWRRTPGEPSRMVIGRYCSLSFLGGRGELEGVLNTSGYWNPLMLPYGADFNGDGVEETLCLGAGALFHIDGDNQPIVRDPGGALYFPQVYRQTGLPLPDGEMRGGFGGARNLVFEILPWGGATRYVLVVSGNFAAIYDGKTRKWAFTWAPPVPILAAAATVSTRNELQLLLATGDGLLRQLEWKDRLENVIAFRSAPFDDRLSSITARPAECAGHALLCGAKGLYLLRNLKPIERLREGSFHTAAILAAKEADVTALVAVTATGETLRLDRRARR